MDLVTLWRGQFSESRGGSASSFKNLIPMLVDDRIIGASENGTVSAIDKNRGVRLWSTQVGGGVIAGVGEGDGTVAVVSGTNKVHGISSDSGSPRWETPVDATVFTPPLVYRGTVVLQTIDGDLIALDSSSGQVIWDTPYNQPEFVVFGSPRPLGIGNLVLVGNATGRVIATDLTTGFESWQVYLAAERSETALSQAETIPVVFGDKLYISDYTKAVLAYDLNTGNLQWQQRRQSKRRLAVGANRVYGVDLNDKVFALSRADGSVLWERSSFLYRKVSNIALVGEHLVIGDSSGVLHILNIETGEIVGRKNLKGSVLFGGFLVDGDKLFVAFRSGQVEAMRLSHIN